MTKDAHPKPLRIGILVLPKFTALHLDIVIDGFRIANRVEGYPRFEWSLLTEPETGVKASNGRRYRADAPLDVRQQWDIVFVIAGYQPDAGMTKRVIRWLQAKQHYAEVIAAIDTGTVLLAHAGLGRGRELAIHWEHEDLLRTAFPELELTSTGARIDGRYYTSSGGLSAATTVLDIIRKYCSALVTGEVAQILYHAGRSVKDAPSSGRRDPVEQAEALMRQNLQKPLPLDEIAAAVHVHKRTLHRLFFRARRHTPMQRYRELRLNHAHELLDSGRLTLSEVAHLTGYASASAFSTAFKNRFGLPPSQHNRDG